VKNLPVALGLLSGRKLSELAILSCARSEDIEHVQTGCSVCLLSRAGGRGNGREIFIV
jgi:hypothetical protein